MTERQISRIIYAFGSLFIVGLIGWGALNAVPPIPKIFPEQDKLEHICAFGALTLWLSALLGPKRIALYGGLAFLAAVALEVAQGLLSPTRSGDFPDLIASTTGILLAIGFVQLARWLIQSRRSAGHSLLEG